MDIGFSHPAIDAAAPAGRWPARRARAGHPLAWLLPALAIEALVLIAATLPSRAPPQPPAAATIQLVITPPPEPPPAPPPAATPPPPPVVAPIVPDAATAPAAPIQPEARPVPPAPRGPPPRRREAHDHPREQPPLVRTVDKPGLAAPAAVLSGAARATLEGEVRAAVQAALRYPMAARAMHLTGRARVLLDYAGGTVSHPSLLLSSGVPMLDDAALAAARVASYPKPPPEIGDRPLPMMIWIDFSSG